MSKRLAVPDDRKPPSGGGPEDPMLELRIGRLGQILGRHEPFRAEMATTADLGLVLAAIAEFKGRISGVAGRFAYIPTTFQMMSIIATMLIGLTGIIFVAGRYFKP